MVNHRLFALLGLFPFASATCSQNCTWDTITPSQSLIWCPCYDGFFCAKLDVPLDYQNPTLDRASVPLIKLPANPTSSQGSYQGMILINPGGPGGSSIDEVQNNGVAYYQSVTGDNWDIVAFEPRGIYRSEPNVNCSAAARTSSSGKLNSRFVPEVTDEFFTSFIQAGAELGRQCQEVVGGEKDAGPHMSTTTNARDMLSIVDAFKTTIDGRRAAKPSNLLNYFGYSYGTFLGQVFASMFPSRVGHMVLDGVLSLELPLGENLTDVTSPADGVVASFFIYCFEAGPSQCSFYTEPSALSIFNRFNQSFIQLNPQEAKAKNWANATDIETALVTLKTAFYGSVASPAFSFNSLSDALVALEQAIALQNIAAWTEQVIPLIGDPTPAGDADAELRLGILCTDQGNKWYNKSLEDLYPAIEHFREVSIIGEIIAKSMLGCLGWSIEAAETFTGPFGGDTQTPILFVGNTYDPVSPVTKVTGNTCQKAKVNAYFQTTQMPGNDSYCALETGPFGIVLNATLENTIMEAGLSQLVQ
ncbi:hypothetical protein FHL15_011349 [Xylaria flabelliformis]|uniref:AB hydrolase-1 domain-containing protein n=1 Tax=Xylaria flabelliformis TaxID=2512241 RepID=A0A553HII3_9PEZI|nr:hypothetical protein FHL15_011349 [Xylaria flabelliformis]